MGEFILTPPTPWGKGAGEDCSPPQTPPAPSLSPPFFLPPLAVLLPICRYPVGEGGGQPAVVVRGWLCPPPPPFPQRAGVSYKMCARASLKGPQKALPGRGVLCGAGGFHVLLR